MKLSALLTSWLVLMQFAEYNCTFFLLALFLTIRCTRAAVSGGPGEQSQTKRASRIRYVYMCVSFSVLINVNRGSVEHKSALLAPLIFVPVIYDN